MKENNGPQFVVDARLLSLESSGIGLFYEPLLISVIQNYTQYKIYLISYDTAKIRAFCSYKNVELICIKKPRSAFEKAYHDIFLVPYLVSKVDGKKIFLSPYYDTFAPFVFGKSIITIHDLCYFDCSHRYHPLQVFYNFILLFANSFIDLLFVISL